MAGDVIYRIRDWDKLFENNRSRDLKTTSWVPVPNTHEGDGYKTLLDHPDGPAHYGAWHAILQVASRCGVRGTLVRSCGELHTAESIARLAFFPERVISDALERLVSVEIDWIEVLDPKTLSPIPQAGATIPQATDVQTGTDPAPAPQAPSLFSSCSSLSLKEEEKSTSKGKKAQGKNPAGGCEIPAELDTPEFRAAWADWAQHRKEIRRKLTLSQSEKQLERLAGMGPARAVACIEHTIERGWTGLREPDSVSKPTGSLSAGLDLGE
jgi:hypothetical protein